MSTEKREPYVIVRGRNVGVHAGYLHKDEPNLIVLRDARRIWYWDGAASLSGLAVHGTSKPEKCRFPAVVPHQELRGLDRIENGDYEVIHCTKKGMRSIQGVPEWRA